MTLNGNGVAQLGAIGIGGCTGYASLRTMNTREVADSVLTIDVDAFVVGAGGQLALSLDTDGAVSFDLFALDGRFAVAYDDPWTHCPAGGG